MWYQGAPCLTPPPPYAHQLWQRLLEIFGPCHPTHRFSLPLSHLPTSEPGYLGGGAWCRYFPDCAVGLMPAGLPPPYPLALKVVRGIVPHCEFPPHAIVGQLLEPRSLAPFPEFGTHYSFILSPNLNPPPPPSNVPLLWGIPLCLPTAAYGCLWPQCMCVGFGHHPMPYHRAIPLPGCHRQLG